MPGYLAGANHVPEAVLVSTYLSYQLIARDIPKSLSRVEQQPVVQRETDYYLANIGKVKTIEDFVGDDRLFNYAMKANGLGDMIYAKAFMVKALKEGVSSNDSFANTLSDTRYRDFVKVFNFELSGEKTTQTLAAGQGTVDKYVRQTLEETEGDKNEGVRLALYFERKAPELSNYYEILADPALSQVVRTALGLPDSFAQVDIDKQVSIMKERFDLADFQDSDKLNTFLQRFTSLWELDNPSSSTAQTSIGALFGQPTEFGISTDLLLTMQQMRR